MRSDFLISFIQGSHYKGIFSSNSNKIGSRSHEYMYYVFSTKLLVADIIVIKTHQKIPVVNLNSNKNICKVLS